MDCTFKWKIDITPGSVPEPTITSAPINQTPGDSLLTSAIEPTSTGKVS